MKASLQIIGEKTVHRFIHGQTVKFTAENMNDIVGEIEIEDGRPYLHTEWPDRAAYLMYEGKTYSLDTWPFGIEVLS
jgi:hypothetical protein